MRVAGDGFGRRARQRAQLRRAPFQARHRRRRSEIADVLAGDQAPVREQRGRALLVSAEGEHPPAHERRRDRVRHVAARPAQELRAARADLRDRVIDGANDRAIVRQPEIGDLRQPRQRLGLVDAEGLLRAVSAGADQRAPGGAGQEIMQRRARQHETEATETRCDARRNRVGGGAGRRSRRTIGAAGDASSASSSLETTQSWRASSIVATSNANGFSSRCFRARSRATAASLVASVRSWYPPSPLSARISPARSASAAAASARSRRATTAPSPDSSASAGPQAGQAIASA